MTTLIQYHDPGSGTRRRCDARCYNAKTKTCRCICLSANHGVGEDQAIDNTSEVVAGLIEELDAEHITNISPYRQLRFPEEEP